MGYLLVLLVLVLVGAIVGGCLSGWAGINCVRMSAMTWQRWNAFTPNARPKGSCSIKATKVFRGSKISENLEMMYLDVRFTASR